MSARPPPLFVQVEELPRIRRGTRMPLASAIALGLALAVLVVLAVIGALTHGS